MNGITRLPDGSAFFTADVMSKDEAMQLPPDKRPLCYRISNEMYMSVWEAIGEATNCYDPIPPIKTFEPEKASAIVVGLCFKIAKELEKPRTGP